MRRTRYAKGAALGAAALLLAACGGGAAGRSASGTVVPATSTPREEYRIGPEDVLQITVWRNDNLSRTVPVRPDGKISLPLVNDVQAAGLTTLELREVLTQKLGDFIASPEVAVIV